MPFGKIERNPHHNALMINGDDGHWYYYKKPPEPLPTLLKISTVVAFDQISSDHAPPGLHYADNVRAATFLELCGRTSTVVASVTRPQVKMHEG